MKQKGKTMQQITHDLATLAWAQSMYPNSIPPLTFKTVFKPFKRLDFEMIKDHIQRTYSAFRYQ